MQELRWSRAADLLDNVADPDDTVRMLTNIARNFAAIEKSRPELYRALIVCGGNSPYSLAVTPHGDYIVVRKDENGKQALLSSPYQVFALKQKYTSEFEISSPICLAGIGDGSALNFISELDSNRTHDQQYAVYLIEPDLRILWIALRLHDFTQENGPITNQRYYWFTGSEWASTLKQFVIDEVMIPIPKTIELIGMSGENVITVFKEAASYHSLEEQRLKKELKSYYDSISPGSFAKLFSGTSQRTPRILAITPRLSTVIKYSAKDTLRAFKDMGYETRLFMEPTVAHRFTPLSLVRELVEFKPDAVLIINHLRYEYQDIFPPQLPFLCWIQDHLLSLCNKVAGKSIGLRDFVLTGIKPVYTGSYCYPKRQCIDIAKLTRIPHRPKVWKSESNDITYVSNASYTIEALVEETIGYAETKPDLQEFIQDCCDSMITRYRSGDSLPTMWHVRQLVNDVCKETDYDFPAKQWKDDLIRILNHPLNDTLYRQQALRWASKVAKKLGLSLKLYGKGWENNPEFAPFASGYVEYGSDLEELTRESSINLQIIPSICLHQRMLDGLVAGGFFLVRDHPSNLILPEVSAFLEAHFDNDVESNKQALHLASASGRTELNGLIERAECLTDYVASMDLVEWVRGCQRAGLLSASSAILPRYDEISFSDEVTLSAKIQTFMHDKASRQEIADTQRQFVETRLTYTAGFDRVIRRMAKLLREEADGKL